MDLREKFRPMNVGDIIDIAFKLYKENFWTFFGILALTSLPFSLIFVVLGALPKDGKDLTPTMIAVIAISAIAYVLAVLPIVYGALTHAVSQVFLGNKIDIISAYRLAAKKIGKFLLTYLFIGLIYIAVYIAITVVIAILTFTLALTGLKSGIGAFAMITFIVIFAALAVAVLQLWLALVVQAITIENLSGLAAIQRSKELVSGTLFKVFLVLLCFWLLVVVIQLAIMGIEFFLKYYLPEPTIAIFITSIAGAIVQTVIAPITFIGKVLLYYDLRIRKEGFDLEMLSKNMNPEEPIL